MEVKEIYVEMAANSERILRKYPGCPRLLDIVLYPRSSCVMTQMMSTRWYTRLPKGYYQ